MDDARVLVDLAEQVLRVDEVQPPAEEPAEGQPEAREMLLLSVDHETDHCFLAAHSLETEAFANSVDSAGAGDDVVVFIECREWRVVEGDGERKEIGCTTSERHVRREH